MYIAFYNYYKFNIAKKNLKPTVLSIFFVVDYFLEDINLYETKYSNMLSL